MSDDIIIMRGARAIYDTMLADSHDDTLYTGNGYVGEFEDGSATIDGHFDLKRCARVVRQMALEEAAQMCLRAHPQSNANAMGHAIMALKDKP